MSSIDRFVLWDGVGLRDVATIIMQSNDHIVSSVSICVFDDISCELLNNMVNAILYGSGNVNFSSYSVY
ncbi:hypothetical protein BW13_01240 [Bifidobacterium sp. UTCIF-37]|nr:hypothetical protein BW13_01240 [Bifidobacterium sp. UTCIF-37]TPF91280.1 hypothetical protein BW11_01240 [Bifidobacterium sp. UTCIF-38]